VWVDQNTPHTHPARDLTIKKGVTATTTGRFTASRNDLGAGRQGAGGGLGTGNESPSMTLKWGDWVAKSAFGAHWHDDRAASVRPWLVIFDRTLCPQVCCVKRHRFTAGLGGSGRSKPPRSSPDAYPILLMTTNEHFTGWPPSRLTQQWKPKGQRLRKRSQSWFP
jgi:hypothetical protein